MHLAQELLTLAQCSGGSRSFAKESPEGEERSDRPSEVDNHQLRAIIETDPFTMTQDIAEDLNINHSTVIWHEANWKGEKAT